MLGERHREKVGKDGPWIKITKGLLWSDFHWDESKKKDAGSKREGGYARE